MRRIELLAGMLSAGLLCAQVVSPPEIRDPELRELQQKHFAELKAVAVAIASHQFPYRFYFSRTLDLNEDQQKTRDQRSIQFAKYGHQTVVEILGNYYAAYSDELMKREERARRTFEDVMLPMLRAEVSQLSDEPKMQGFALEISHHVRKKVLGVSGEHPENVVLVIPKAAALRLVSAPAVWGAAGPPPGPPLRFGPPLRRVFGWRSPPQRRPLLPRPPLLRPSPH